MTVLKALPLIAIAIILATVVTIRPDAVVAQGQSSLQAPADVTVRDDDTPGDVVISWNTVDAADYYRIGWVAYPDYEEIHLNGGRPWDEAFAFVDVENIGQTSRTVRRLTPGTLYAFRVGSKSAKDGASKLRAVDSVHSASRYYGLPRRGARTATHPNRRRRFKTFQPDRLRRKDSGGHF